MSLLFLALAKTNSALYLTHLLWFFFNFQLFSSPNRFSNTVKKKTAPCGYFHAEKQGVNRRKEDVADVFFKPLMNKPSPPIMS